MELFSVKETKIFFQIFEKINTLSDQITLRVEKKGLFLQSLDSAYVVLCDLKIKKSFFKDFLYKDERTLEIGIYTKSLIKILKALDFTDVWNFKYENDKLLIFTENKMFGLTLLDLEYEMMLIEEPEYFLSVSCASNVIKKIIKDIGIHDCEDIVITITKLNVIFCSETESGNCKILLDPKNSQEKDDLVEKLKNLNFHDSEFLLTFSFKYLDRIITNSNENVILNFHQTNPLKIEYKEKDYSLKFFLAPKIEEEMQD